MINHSYKTLYVVTFEALFVCIYSLRTQSLNTLPNALFQISTCFCLGVSLCVRCVAHASCCRQFLVHCFTSLMRSSLPLARAGDQTPRCCICVLSPPDFGGLCRDSRILQLYLPVSNVRKYDKQNRAGKSCVVKREFKKRLVRFYLQLQLSLYLALIFTSFWSVCSFIY